MTITSAAKPAAQSAKPEPTTKNQQVIELLAREGGVTLDKLSATAGWLPHSTRSFMTGLRKKGHVIASEQVEGIRRYHIVPKGAA